MSSWRLLIAHGIPTHTTACACVARPFVMATVAHIAPVLAARTPTARVPKRAAVPARHAVAPRASFSKRSLVVEGVRAVASRSSTRLRAASTPPPSSETKHPPANLTHTEVQCAALFAAFTVAFFAADPASAADMAADGMNTVDGLNNVDVSSTELFTLAGSEVPFWANMVKYARFSISIMVGFVFMFGRPVVNLLKKPQTAALVIGGGFFGFKFFKFTIETMLGMNDDMTMNY